MIDFDEMLAAARAATSDSEVDHNFLDSYQPGSATQPGRTSTSEPVTEQVADAVLESSQTSVPPPLAVHEEQLPPDDVASGAELDDALLDGQEAEAAFEDRQDQIYANRTSDQRDQIQGLTGKSSGGGTGVSEKLPESAFSVGDVAPAVRNMPRPILDALRDALVAAAVRDLGVDENQADHFARKLSQGALVVALVVAVLNVDIEVDAATAVAVRLFRSRDPQLGVLMDAVLRLEAGTKRRDAASAALNTRMGELQNTSAATEQAMAYLIADRTENFLRGSHNVREAPITHKDALFVRDLVRESTAKQAEVERHREGRPIR